MLTEGTKLNDDFKIDARTSRSIDILRIFLCISVIAAHVGYLMEHPVIKALWNHFARCGVVGFFIISGFLYKRKIGDGYHYWKKKFVNLILPWLLCSFITYTIAYYDSFQWKAYLKWFLGIGTWYYFLPVLIFFLLFAKFILFPKTLFKIARTVDVKSGGGGRYQKSYC